MNTELKKFLELMENLSQTDIKQLDADVSIEKPFMFILRTKEKNVKVIKDNENSLILMRNDRYKTRISIIPVNEIKEVKFKQYADNLFDIWFYIREPLKTPYKMEKEPMKNFL